MNMKNLPTREEILREFFNHWIIQRAEEYISLDKAVGRVISEDIYSKNTLPVNRSSKMDGICVKYFDLEKNLSKTENWIKGKDYSMADTGDDFPEEFDTVIPIENIEFFENKGITINLPKDLHFKSNINEAGSNVEKGELLLSGNSVVNSFHLNLIASGGHNFIKVYKKPIVTYIPTGSELIYPTIPPSRGDNIESNGIMVKELVNQFGGEFIQSPICKDIKNDLETILKESLKYSDIVLINGGSSKGSEDFNTKIIENQSSFFQHYVKSVPGFPIGIGLIDNKPVINIPGPPMATIAVMNWCVKPLIENFINNISNIKNIAYGNISEDINAPENLDYHIRLRVIEKDNNLIVHPLKGNLRNSQVMASCNAIAILKSGKHYKKGDLIRFRWI